MYTRISYHSTMKLGFRRMKKHNKKFTESFGKPTPLYPHLITQVDVGLTSVSFVTNIFRINFV